LKSGDAKPPEDNPNTTKWWVDTGGNEKVRNKRPPGPAGMSFFQVGHDFEQERARDRLTDNNLKILMSVNPPEAEWSYLQFAETTFPKRELDRVKKLVELPRYGRGIIIDCGRSIRLLVTATPVGARILELTLGEAPSFDCWINQEWVREEVFDDGEKAIRAFRRFIYDYLAPESIVRYESIAARA
jgi:hypothetical protein